MGGTRLFDRRHARARGAAAAAFESAVWRTVADPGLAQPGAEELVAAYAAQELAALAGAALEAVVISATEQGWTPSDLAQLLRRRVNAGAVAVAAGPLRRQAEGVPADRVAAGWRAELAALPPAADPDGGDPNALGAAGLARVLRVVAALWGLPRMATTIPPPGAEAGERSNAVAGEAVPSAAAARQLARVRALLAKAESTTFEAEAEALTAKAQELITRHALQRLLTRTGPAAGGVAPSTRRVWLEAPYMGPKAMVVAAVAGANRCRAAISEGLGCVHLVGDAGDLDDVELLATSLLVQADAAMLRPRPDSAAAASRGARPPRARAFRHAFLVAYATRVGERLREAGDAAVDDAARTGADTARLLPVLRAVSERVDREFARVFPDLGTKRTTVSHAGGWAAGRAAADVARLSVRDQVHQ